MSTGLKISLAVFACVALIFIGGCSAVIGIYNNCISQEATIKAQYKQNQNNYDNYFKKVKEMAQVPEMYVEDMKKLWDGVMTGRYGQNGSKATWQWIKEHNPNIDPSLYTKIQNEIAAGRTDFENNQKLLLDKKRVYEDTYLKTFPGGFIASLMGFPKMDLSKMDIITSEETEKAFKEKKAGAIQIRTKS